MPRVRTDAAERKAQRDATVEQVAAELGRPVTIQQAVDHRKQERGRVVLSSLTSDVELDLNDLEDIGVILAAIKDFRIQAGGYATLQLVTDGRSYADVLSHAALRSQSHNLIVTLSLTPKPEDMDDDDAEEAFTGRVG